MNQDSPRRRARELVLLSLYACEHGELDPQETFESLTSEERLSKKNLEFAQGLYNLVTEHTAWADKQIADLAENWRLERMAAIDRDILRMAMVELEHLPDTPVKVVLNEAIELAKKYSTTESSRFVNGILDHFVKNTQST